jgi:hypothetical protein
VIAGHCGANYGRERTAVALLPNVEGESHLSMSMVDWFKMFLVGQQTDMSGPSTFMLRYAH